MVVVNANSDLALAIGTVNVWKWMINYDGGI